MALSTLLSKNISKRAPNPIKKGPRSCKSCQKIKKNGWSSGLRKKTFAGGPLRMPRFAKWQN
ncbi:hypothetical protein P152DRAFT_409659 [Eremomyces bilateralis CBS 781.70]|uniref:Uncharacterized protein n=1 Tax=Eremomyces bilateralis CBS 781.70 TaxID=1392243 RepID=A0A6G1GEV9_9PEZI|nr:uncharacterized protein P152DRAFT_409659 [Eremomyces bilateralis CBS 781.70]KAF1816598.1 hypothetical protein P152DRAFT_409659 [Eremomyces bilateralis CBS 781.70]